MNDMNSVYLVGRLVANPKTKNGLITFTLANNNYMYDKRKKEYVAKTIFFNVEISLNYLPDVKGSIKKGIRVGVNGFLAENGIIHAVTIQILDKGVKE